jgi:aryl-alcohol dehydrogenase-like predicted oxidoreductase
MGRLILGTAQFGMDYGINNRRGKIPGDEAFKILDLAFEVGIDTLDTAYLYGDSESVIGKFIKARGLEFKVISKLPKCSAKDVEKILVHSLEKLGIKNFYGYLIHDFPNFIENIEIWDILNKFKSDGIIDKLGFSIYFTRELEYILSSGIKFDLLQVPYNIFDRRFETYFSRLKEMDIEVHVRSIFLQGLVFKDPDELTGFFDRVRWKIKELQLLSMKLEIPIFAICLNFALLNKHIDGVIFGIDNLDNLVEIIGSLDYLDAVSDIYDIFYIFEERDEKLILPINWRF